MSTWTILGAPPEPACRGRVHSLSRRTGACRAGSAGSRPGPCSPVEPTPPTLRGPTRGLLCLLPGSRGQRWRSLWLERIYDPAGSRSSTSPSPKLGQRVTGGRLCRRSGTHRGWLALRRGDLRAAGVSARSRTALAAAELPAPPIYRVFHGRSARVEALTDQGELAPRPRKRLPRSTPRQNARRSTRRSFRFARARLRLEQGRVTEGARRRSGGG